MTNKITVANTVDRDVVLCETTNRIVSIRLAKILMAGAVPFTSQWSRIPLYKRGRYQGASSVCRIVINKCQYSKARRVIEGLEDRDYQRLRLNVI